MSGTSRRLEQVEPELVFLWPGVVAEELTLPSKMHLVSTIDFFCIVWLLSAKRSMVMLGSGPGFDSRVRKGLHSDFYWQRGRR